MKKANPNQRRPINKNVTIKGRYVSVSKGIPGADSNDYNNLFNPNVPTRENNQNNLDFGAHVGVMFLK